MVKMNVNVLDTSDTVKETSDTVKETSDTVNPMKNIRISKVCINIGLGKSGEIVEKAKAVLTQIAGQTVGESYAKKTLRDFGIRKGDPIGVVVTLRKKLAEEKLKLLFTAKDNRISKYSFDKNGGCSFGIKEHIELPGVKYDPNLGIFGMDVTTVLDRPGYRINKKKRIKGVVGQNHRVTKDEAINFFKNTLNIEVY